MLENPDQLPEDEKETSTEAPAPSVAGWEDQMEGFSGNACTKLDDRGRLKMPAEFRGYVEEKYGKGFNAFYITSRDGDTAEIYPMPEWRKREVKIFSLPPSHPVRKKLWSAYTRFGSRVDMDPQGRLVLPEEIRKKGVVREKDEVQVSAEGDFLRVTNMERLRAEVDSNPLNEQDNDFLATIGM
jgi:MraZ protein